MNDTNTETAVTNTNTETAAEAPRHAESPARAPRRSRSTIEWTGKPLADDPELHRSAKAVVQTLIDAGQPVSREALCALLNGVDTGTKQPARRVVYYWTKPLIDKGFIKINRPAPRAKASPTDGAVPAVETAPAVEAAPVEAAA